MEEYGDLENWRKAGKIAAEVREYGRSLVVKGASLLEVSDKIDQKIYDLGAEPAFPSQISCDHIAAHYSAHPDDDIIFDNQLVCLDVGAHVDGAIGDTATTIDLSGKHTELVQAAEDALQRAIEVIKPGVTLGEVGKAIHEAITSRGFSPIRNLSGHGLGLYNVHVKPSVPNFDTGDPYELQQGQIIAVEPFATNGAGIIYETENATIFHLSNKKPVRSPITRQILKEIEKYKGLPFTTRWLTKKFPVFKVNYALKELINVGALTQHPPLPDKNKGLVSQAEHTVLVDDKPEILTLS